MFQQDKIQHYLLRLRDVRVIGQVVFVGLVLWISWSGVNIIHTNYKLQQQIARIQQENEIQKLKNDNQRLKNEYYKSPQYLELAARQNFGLAAPGEKELLVPKEVALAHLPAVSNEQTLESESTLDSAKQPFYQRNLKAWLDFFLHRQSTIN